MLYRPAILFVTFLSAALLFSIQPLYAKYLLPYFGGTSAVWTVSLFFYSAVLLMGYIYASLLITWSAKVGRIIHGSLMGLLLLSLFLTVSGGEVWLFGEVVTLASPALSTLATLFAGVGLPVLVLASTSVIVQKLYAERFKTEPYALYAVSNAGSLIGLLLYPLVFEPLFPISGQMIFWSGLFVVFATVLVLLWQKTDYGSTPVLRAAVRTLTTSQKLQIISYASIPTFLLASLTELLSRGIASFPLLWVVPLAVYLVSFIIAFSDKTVVSRQVLGMVGAVGSIFSVIALLIMNANVTVFATGFVVVMLTFLVLATYFHSVLYEKRPDTRELGSFYVWLTFGGALGSGAVGFLMPLLLNDQIEGFVVLTLVSILLAFSSVPYIAKFTSDMFAALMKYSLIVCASLLLFVVLRGPEAVAEGRNFYGDLAVYHNERTVAGEQIPVRVIVHGTINHGMQALDSRYYQDAASYYGPGSGIDIAIKRGSDRGTEQRVMVVGLGAGMMSAYCDEMTVLDYIEVNPLVIEFAQNHFTYLDLCPEKTRVLEGDGRIVLDGLRAEGSTQYDVIMMDAFTDDAIPVHLLTLEAVRDVYLPLLSDEGIIAFHVTNKFLDLFPPLAGVAEENNLQMFTVFTEADPENELHLSTSWVLLATDSAAEQLATYEGVRSYTGEKIVWTDERNSMLEVLSRQGGMKHAGQ